ncbi:hypothetical protein DVH24_038783 [Malus domestica]|uniref:Uncharacterized protein n=1 Tax=Malus domestica TaxID=3750 RepID=A0A498K8A2_MALDO|nr:hypothetical protein DVH24_038783 [Malus domestica]
MTELMKTPKIMETAQAEERKAKNGPLEISGERNSEVPLFQSLCSHEKQGKCVESPDTKYQLNQD